MVGPVPVSPFSHEVIIDAGDHYETGTYRFWSPRLRLDAVRIPKNDHAPEVAAARDGAGRSAASSCGRAFRSGRSSTPDRARA